LQCGSGKLDLNSGETDLVTSEAHAQQSKLDARAKDRVMVKVTSKSCHRMLLLPDHAFLWSLEGTTREPARGVLALISESLHAFYLTGGTRFQLGLVQIMPDLHDMGYRPLRPKALCEHGFQKVMCKAFVRLIKQTLVPMALLNVVHADIRSRYHETANVLCHKDNCSMRLIDLDSLMEIRFLEKIPEDQRTISRENGEFSKWISCALEFVCLQAICVVSAWGVGKEMQLMSPNARSEAEKELDTEYVIRTYLVDKVWGGTEPTFAVDESRKLYFAKPDCDACSFVLGEVRPFLERFLGEPPDELAAMLELDY
jgi:hypothetical protein